MTCDGTYSKCVVVGQRGGTWNYFQNKLCSSRYLSVYLRRVTLKEAIRISFKKRASTVTECHELIQGMLGMPVAINRW